MKAAVNFIISIILLSVLSSCSKKEPALPAPTVFAGIIFDDPFNVGPLTIHYQGKPLADVYPLGTVLTILPGEGKFEFFNAGGVRVLEKKLVTDANSTRSYIYYKPNPDAEEVDLIENNQLSEPEPAIDHIKVKIANLAQSLFGDKDIKVIFSQNDIALDTIETSGIEYTNKYVELPRAFKIVRNQKRVTPLYVLTFLNENNQLIVAADNTPLSYEWRSSLFEDINIFTFFIREGSPGIPDITVLFEN